MKVSVCAQVTYIYECEIPDDTEEVVFECDVADPVYQKLCKVLDENHLNFDGEIISVQDDETGKFLYMD